MSPIDLESHAFRLLSADSADRCLSGATVLHALFEAPGYLASLTSLQQFKLAGVLLSAHVYTPSSKLGNKDAQPHLPMVLDRLWRSWLSAVDPWHMPAQRLSAEQLDSVSYWEDLLGQKGNESFEELPLPSLGWQVAAAAVKRGVPSALKALLALPSAPSAADVSARPVAYMDLRRIAAIDKNPSLVPSFPLDVSLLGAVLDRQIDRIAVRQDERDSFSETLALLGVLKDWGIDFTMPIGSSGLHPLALAQSGQVFDELRSAGALTRLPSQPADALGAQVWSIPFLLKDRWYALPEVLERWEAIARTEWTDAENWLFAFTDSFQSMPRSDVSHSSNPFKELLLPVMKVARAAGTSPQAAVRNGESWPSAVCRGLVQTMVQNRKAYGAIATAEDLVASHLCQGWEPRPGESAWATIALAVSQLQTTGVLGRASREQFLGKENQPTGAEVAEAFGQLARTQEGIFLGMVAWARLQNGWTAEVKHQALTSLFKGVLAHRPLSLKGYSFTVTGNTFDQVKGLWKKAFEEQCEQVSGQRSLSGDQALVTLGLGIFLDRLGSVPPLPPLSSPVPQSKALLDRLGDLLCGSTMFASWLRSQALNQVLPESKPSVRGPRF